MRTIWIENRMLSYKKTEDYVFVVFENLGKEFRTIFKILEFLKMKKRLFYIRTINRNGIYLKQWVTPIWVFTYSFNKLWMNGGVGKKFEIKRRNQTLL